MGQNSDESFSKKMRIATRDVHKISDNLINAKLAFAITDDAVWADGLLIFYEIFRFLENNAPKDILPEEFHRAPAFEADISYYLGEDWLSSYTVRKEVHEYLNHLEDIYKENPINLLAYVYHLYMGLLSGGQVLQKKRALFRRINILSDENEQEGGFAITKFGNSNINELKTKMRKIVDDKAMTLDKDVKDKLLVESRTVFDLNNKIVRTIKDVNQVGLRKVMIFGAFISIFIFVCKTASSLL